MKRLGLLLLMTLMILTVTGIVYAADPTITVAVEKIPGTAITRVGGTGSIKYNVSVYLSKDSPQVENCSIVAYSVKTDNSSSTDYINGSLYGLTAIWSHGTGTFNGTDGNRTKWNFTMRANDLEDSNDYTFKATCNVTNAGTTRLITGTVTGITVDNVRPVAATLTGPAEAETDTDGQVTFTGTVADKNTTSCSLVFSNEGPTPTLASYAMDYSATSCSLTAQLPMGSGYKWGIAAFDTQNTTLSSYRTLSVRTMGNLPQKALYLQSIEGQASRSSTLVWGAIILGALYLFSKQKKK